MAKTWAKSVAAATMKQKKKDDIWEAWRRERDRNPFSGLPSRPKPINKHLLAYELPRHESMSEGGIIVPTSVQERALPKAVVLDVPFDTEGIHPGDCIVFSQHSASKIGSFGHLMIPLDCVLFVGEPPPETND